LALNHRWGALEEQAQAMPKLARPEDDTYRVYLVALAKEAQAYDLAREANERDQGKRKDLSAQDAEAEFRRAQRYMDEAGSLYKEIVTANSREKEFRPGDARTEQAIAIYATIARYKEEYQKAVVANQAKKQLERNSSAAAASSVVTPLNQVLDFCNRGMEADIIKEYLLSPDFIHDARATGYHFNFAKDSVSISDACKANASVIIKLMRERLGAVTPASQRKK
jgi:rhamnose utilization protein RhaD (predicted bifunctional aldolase and dehydrogenase)